MADRVLTLDALCAILADAFHATNASLARDPLPEPGSAGPVFPYRIEREAKYALRTIPYSELQRTHRYRLNDLALSVPCCVLTRRIGIARQTVLSLRAPPWWKHIGRPLVCKRMHIDIHAHAMELRFSPVERAALPRSGDHWTLLLTLDQRQVLAASSDVATDPPSQPSRTALHRRLTQWLRCKPANNSR